MKVEYYRDFFVQQFDRYKTICNILEEWGYKGTSFDPPSGTYNPIKDDKLVEYLDKKRFFEEVLNPIPTRLKMFLELFYRFRKKEISYKELKNHVSLPLNVFFSAVNWAVYLFFEGFQIKKEYENDSKF